MSFTGKNGRAWENYGPSYTNQTLPSEDPNSGNVSKVYGTGQLGKRMRSSSNEDYNSRLSQVQAWLKDQATAEDFEKIWQIFLESTASSSTQTYGGTDLLYQASLKDIDLVPDIPARSSISADPAFTSGLGLSGGFGQNQSFVDPKSLISDFSMNSSAGQTSTLSAVSQGEPYYSAIPCRSRASLRPGPSKAAEAACLMLRQPLVKSKDEKAHDSMRSTSPYNSVNLDASVRWSSNNSSTSSLGGQSVPSLRKSSQKPMHMSVKKSHSRSSSTSRAHNFIQSSDIPCTYSGCTSTFTRDPDRARHESHFHSNKIGYTCLLHTCVASCPDPCEDRIHNYPYHNGRPDKMKEHLEKVHSWSLKVNEIPKAFRQSYDRQQRGWVCSACGNDLGSWHDNRGNIEGHDTICEAVLQASFKRMSVEEPGVSGAKKGGDMEKGWPLSGGPEDQSCEWL